MTGTTGFEIRLDDGLRRDLRRRLGDIRWADAVTDDWSEGMRKAFLAAVLSHWRDGYDFEAAEARMNAAAQFRSEVDGFGIYHRVLRGRGPKPLPLLLLNGWPSSFVEYGRLAPMLADPASHGGVGEDAFDVVIPALPGFGWSDRPDRPGPPRAAELFHALMTERLGHARYVVSGTDIGAGVATRLALSHPDSVMGIHVASVVDPPLAPGAMLTPAEQGYLARAKEWEAKEGAYEHVHYTRPQTLAFGLADSPAGLASWIVEKFHSWSDHGPDLTATFPLDMLVDNLMVYWATNTIGSSMRSYWDHAHFAPPLMVDERVTVPTAVCMWPKDLVTAPREWAERFYDVRQYTMQAHGGHFPAWEAPEAYAADLRRFARGLV